jgi:hypothetical protein
MLKAMPAENGKPAEDSPTLEHFKTEGCCTPRITLGQLQKWYATLATAVKKEKTSLRHPPAEQPKPYQTLIHELPERSVHKVF